MKLKIIYRFTILAVMLICLLISGCVKEDRLDVPEQTPVQFDTSTEIGKRQKEIYEKYGVIIEYDWDRFVFPEFTSLDPIKLEAVIPMLDILEILYFEPLSKRGIEADFSESFVLREAPLYFYISGSGIYFQGERDFQRSEGTAGVIDPDRLVYGQLNDYFRTLAYTDSDFLAVMYEKSFMTPANGGFIGSLYHEYAHFIDLKYLFSQKFSSLSKNDYAGPNWDSNTEQIAKEKGFITAYGMKNVAEDFATFVQFILSEDEETLKNKYLLTDTATKKHNMTLELFKNLGLDLIELRTYLYSDEVKAKLLKVKLKYQPTNAGGF